MEISPLAAQESTGVDPTDLSQVRPTPIQRSKSKVKWIVLVLFLTSACILLIAETYLRMHIPPSTFLVNETYTERPHFVPVRDWQGSHYLAPFTIDENGYRSMPSGDNAASAIVFIGDSFVFGSGVKDDETIPAYFLDDLKRAGRHERVINAAFPAYGPFNYRCRFEEVVATESKIEFAFIGLFAGNDFMDVYDEETKREPLTFGRRLEIFSENNIKTFRWLKTWWTQLRSSSGVTASDERLARFRDFLRGESDLAKRCIQNGLEELLAIQRIAEARNIKVFFFYLPIPQQVTRKANADGLYLKDVWPADPKLLENIPGKMFLDFCATHHMNGIDLSNAFRKSPIPITHFPGEPTNKTVLMPIGTAHLSPEGCRLVADVLFDLFNRGQDRIQ